MSQLSRPFYRGPHAGPRVADASGLMQGIANALPISGLLWCVVVVVARLTLQA